MNKAKHSIDDIKLFMLCILSGRAEREHALHYLCALADFGDISNPIDFEVVSDLTATSFFITKSMEFLDRKEYDEWIEYYKQELLKREQYEIVNNLHL
jgi:hypothetical protein